MKFVSIGKLEEYISKMTQYIDEIGRVTVGIIQDYKQQIEETKTQ